MTEGLNLSPGKIKNFHFSISSRPALGFTQPPIQSVPGPLSLGVKQKGCEDFHTGAEKTLYFGIFVSTYAKQ
jgi:hypothetical protein